LNSKKPQSTLLVFYGIDTIANIVCTFLIQCIVSRSYTRPDPPWTSYRLGEQSIPAVYIRRLELDHFPS
jgi:hypothetical protein